MRYYKIIEGAYIQAIGIGGGGEEITEEQYNAIMALIHRKPPRTDTTDYRLIDATLTWEEYERPADPEPEAEVGELFDILTGEQP